MHVGTSNSQHRYPHHPLFSPRGKGSNLESTLPCSQTYPTWVSIDVFRVEDEGVERKRRREKEGEEEREWQSRACRCVYGAAKKRSEELPVTFSTLVHSYSATHSDPTFTISPSGEIIPQSHLYNPARERENGITIPHLPLRRLSCAFSEKGTVVISNLRCAGVANCLALMT